MVRTQVAAILHVLHAVVSVAKQRVISEHSLLVYAAWRVARTVAGTLRAVVPAGKLPLARHVVPVVHDDHGRLDSTAHVLLVADRQL